jgi:hypothetical protein
LARLSAGRSVAVFVLMIGTMALTPLLARAATVDLATESSTYDKTKTTLRFAANPGSPTR